MDYYFNSNYQITPPGTWGFLKYRIGLVVFYKFKISNTLTNFGYTNEEIDIILDILLRGNIPLTTYNKWAEMYTSHDVITIANDGRNYIYYLVFGITGITITIINNNPIHDIIQPDLQAFEFSSKLRRLLLFKIEV